MAIEAATSTAQSGASHALDLAAVVSALATIFTWEFFDHFGHLMIFIPVFAFVTYRAFAERLRYRREKAINKRRRIE